MLKALKTYNKTLLNIFWFAVIAFLSYRMPVYSDDFWHMTSFATGEKMTSFDMVIPSVCAYYNTWGGRAISMIMIQSVLMLPRMVYALLNGVIYVTMVNILSLYSGKITFAKNCLVCLFVWFFMPDFADVITWTTGTVTYLWMHTIMLGFGLMYYRDYVRLFCADQGGDTLPDVDQGEDTGKSSALRVVLMIILGFCAGLSTEAGACTLEFALFLYVVWMVRGHYRIRADRVAGIVSSLIGFAVLMLSPGNRIRASLASTSAETGSFVSVYAFRIARETFYSLLFLLIPLSICLAMYLWRSERTVRRQMLIFGILAFVGIYVLTFSSGFSNRIFQFPLIMLAIAFALGLPDMSEHMDRTVSVLGVALMLMVVVEVTAGCLYARQSDTFFNRHMYLYDMGEQYSAGLMPGNGMSGLN